MAVYFPFPFQDVMSMLKLSTVMLPVQTIYLMPLVNTVLVTMKSVIYPVNLVMYQCSKKRLFVKIMVLAAQILLCDIINISTRLYNRQDFTFICFRYMMFDYIQTSHIFVAAYSIYCM